MSEPQARRKAAMDSMFGNGVTVAVYRSTDQYGRCYGFFTQFGKAPAEAKDFRTEVIAIYRRGVEVGI